MAFPTFSSAGVEVQGGTTIRWGTAPIWSNYLVVLSTRQREKVFNTYLENGAGIETTRIQGKHGHTWEVTVRDDSRVSNTTDISVGLTVAIFDYAGMFTNKTGETAEGFVHPVSGNPSITARILESEFEAGAKRDGTRVISLEVLNAIAEEGA